jgi:hypothetical protein
MEKGDLLVVVVVVLLDGHARQRYYLLCSLTKRRGK